MYLNWIKIIAGAISIYVFIHNSRNKGNFKKASEKNKYQLEKQKNNEIKILYLRDFSNDGMMEYSKQFGRWELHYEKTNFEVFLSYSLNRIGHLIAIGRAGEEDYIGADRFFFSNESWQDAILEMMKISSLIVFRPTFKSALVWEFEQIIKNGHLHKTIICIKDPEDGKGNYKDFRKMTYDLFPFKLPKPKLWHNYLCINEEGICKFYLKLENVELYKILKEKNIKAGTYFVYEETIEEEEEEVIAKDDTLKNMSEKTAKYLVLIFTLIIVGFVIYNISRK